jgi:hypothetical protein
VVRRGAARRRGSSFFISKIEMFGLRSVSTLKLFNKGAIIP